jgi:hypothetical protein
MSGMAQTLLDSGPVDLSKLGAVSVHRSSEILFDEPAQKFYIHFLEPKLQHLNEAYRSSLFPTYRNAVDAEIVAINKARLSGIL